MWSTLDPPSSAPLAPSSSSLFCFSGLNSSDISSPAPASNPAAGSSGKRPNAFMSSSTAVVAPSRPKIVKVATSKTMIGSRAKKRRHCVTGGGTWQSSSLNVFDSPPASSATMLSFQSATGVKFSSNNMICDKLVDPAREERFASSTQQSASINDMEFEYNQNPSLHPFRAPLARGVFHMTPLRSSAEQFKRFDTAMEEFGTDNPSSSMKLLLTMGTNVLANVLRHVYKSSTNKALTLKSGREIAESMSNEARGKWSRSMLDELEQGHVDEWDIDVLSHLLIVSPRYVHDSKAVAAIEELRNAGNDFTHSAWRTADGEFRSKWNRVRGALETLISSYLMPGHASLLNQIIAISNQLGEVKSDRDHGSHGAASSRHGARSSNFID
ncbi:hypothetical protein GUITHDRAFT_134879 [Guillardia theta CCMP2712]|uniref:Uncharacterized protein n=2 Tax=Guillardia theta TaxID=55529 RepID=L1JQN1_GUITC|nr:hypothetical protein GUITHDRAFT_134879 [Guillardia theta CCMP2712]EKX50757.1 hypothetical protein GUITHDRAFT_134879 [Guillardia theta CCMP2712]|eukprot:XP_005837737.1 hypothetical protein GUITHDRAFT_134879 [Guillardia theta CCMP2712]